MRIRSIRPEFWTSEDIASLAWEHRLIFIGLWSYVDDNGVGRDVEKLILADLFPLEDDQHGALMQIHGALSECSSRSLITRYAVDGKPYLHVTTFSTNQVINRPSRGRYPLPTCDNAQIHPTLSEPSVSPHANAPIGEGEKGRRGEGEKAPATPAASAEFDAFWAVYPKRADKGHARTAYAKALKKTDAETLTLGVKRYAASVTGTDPKFIALPTTWLNGERWDDDPPAARATGAHPWSPWDQPLVGGAR